MSVLLRRTRLLVVLLLVSLAACGSPSAPSVTSGAPSPTGSASAPYSSALAAHLLNRMDLPQGFQQIPTPPAHGFCGRVPHPSPVAKADIAFAQVVNGLPTEIRAGLRHYASAAEARKEFDGLRAWITHTCHVDRTAEATNLISIDAAPKLGQGCFEVGQVVRLTRPQHGIDVLTGRTYYLDQGSMFLAVGIFGPKAPSTALLTRLAKVQLERLVTPWGVTT